MLNPISVVLLISIASSVAFAEKRIKRVYHDLAKTGLIKLVPGLVANVELSCPAEEVNVGLEDRVRVTISKVNPKRLGLVAQGGSLSTNLVVHCQEKSFVFDLVVQNSTHNDLIKVDSEVGDYGLDETKMTLIRSSEGEGLSTVSSAQESKSEYSGIKKELLFDSSKKVVK